MRVIAKPLFVKASIKYPNDRAAIMALYKLLKDNNFNKPKELRNICGSLDNFKYIDKWYVIDIGGNNLRFIAWFGFDVDVCYAKYILTHADYDKLCDKYRGKK